MLDWKMTMTKPKLSNILGLILYFFVLSGPLKPEVEEEVAEHELCLVLCISHPPCFPPKRPTQSAGPPPKAHSRPLGMDQNFDHFLTSFLDRFWLVLGRHLGVIFGTLGAQDGPTSVKNAS